MSTTDMTTTHTAAAKRAPSGIFVRYASAPTQASFLELTTPTAAAKRTPSGIFRVSESALADSDTAN